MNTSFADTRMRKTRPKEINNLPMFKETIEDRWFIVVLFTYVCVYLQSKYVHMPTEARKGHWISWS